MSGVAIYMEGGGTGRDSRAALRLGMDGLLGSLKQAVIDGSIAWSEDVDSCEDALYLELTGKFAEELFPALTGRAVRVPATEETRDA